MQKPKHIGVTLELIVNMFIDGNEMAATRVSSVVNVLDELTDVSTDKNTGTLHLYFNEANKDSPMTPVTMTRISK